MAHQYGYDALGRLTSILQRDQATTGGNPPSGYEESYWFLPKRVTIGYDAVGQKTSILRENTVYDHDPADWNWSEVATSTYEYDAVGRLTELHHERTVGGFSGYSLANHINTFTYQYDVLNRITQFGSIDGTSAYDYDDAGQLLGTNHTGTYLPADEGYEYDAGGNRLEKTSGSSTSTYIIGADNQVLDDGEFEYTYDEEGNRLTKFRKSPTNTDDDFTFYSYDHRNRLTIWSLGMASSTSATGYGVVKNLGIMFMYLVAAVMDIVYRSKPKFVQRFLVASFAIDHVPECIWYDRI